MIIYYLLFFFLLYNFSFIFSFFYIELFFVGLKINIYYSGLLFSLILLIVTVSVLIFSSYYLSGELYFNYYLIVLILFVFRIFLLNFSYNSFTILLSWDLLGISSFFLVLFYNNWDSNSGSINTVLTNRLGDFFLFVFFSFSFFINYNFFSYQFFLWSSLFFLLITSFTKRAQFPFSGWLPKAISAPTPVRSLVHSSTLVTAGLLLLFNFSYFLINRFLLVIVFFIRLFTTLFSSLTAVVEEDIKKVVALSTLSQMGFSILTLSLGYYLVSLVHLLSHALFKRCLFIQIGYLIHCSFGQQDGRFYNNLCFSPLIIQLQIILTLFCLCGIFFFRGLVSKDIILEYFYSNNWYFFMSLLFFFSIYLTFFYRYRLFKSLFLVSMMPIFHYSSSFLVNFLRTLVSTGSVYFIWWLNFNFILVPTFFVYFDFYVPLFYIFIFLFIMSFFSKFILSEFSTKFLVDYLPKALQNCLLNLKFKEFFYYNLSFKFINSLVSFRNLSSIFFYSNLYNSLIFLVLLLFIFLWGLILL